MTDKEKILMYEASNTFLQKYFPFFMPEWLSEFQAKMLARKFNKKWKHYQRSLELNEYMKKLGYEGFETKIKL